MILPILISVSVAPGSYCCAARAGPIDKNGAASVSTAAATARSERLVTRGIASGRQCAGDHRAEQLPPLAVEARQLDLLDRCEIRRAGADRDPQQQHRQAQFVQV